MVRPHDAALRIAVATLGLALGACKGDTTADGGSSSGGMVWPTIDFDPSNVQLDQPIEDIADVVMSGTCTVNGFARGELGCDVPKSAYKFFEQTQPDGTPLGVFVMTNLTIEEDAEIEVSGDTPIAFVAIETIVNDGRLFAAPGEVGGGPSSASALVGNGPGAGDGIEGPVQGGGGAGYCGRGGNHGNGGGGGTTYGNEAIVPLVGGSSGGELRSGKGGGALQLVAGQSIEIGWTVAVVGGGGEDGGGGSGGALLLEAPEVAVVGRVSANGGGGCSGDKVDGQIGRDRASPAPGGQDAQGTAGGEGSAADVIDGADGVASVMTDQQYGSGGGGAGWIRINTASGAADIRGSVSPSLASGCATQGVIAG